MPSLIRFLFCSICLLSVQPIYRVEKHTKTAWIGKIRKIRIPNLQRSELRLRVTGSRKVESPETEERAKYQYLSSCTWYFTQTRVFILQLGPGPVFRSLCRERHCPPTQFTRDTRQTTRVVCTRWKIPLRCFRACLFTPIFCGHFVTIGARVPATCQP